jgi:hypothetical protein
MEKESKTVDRFPTVKAQLRRVMPRTFNEQSWHYFERDRRRSLIARCGGWAGEGEAYLIDQIINAEYQALKLEAAAEAAEREKDRYGRLRLATEYRRQLLLHERDLIAATKRKMAALPSAKVTTLNEHLARRRAPP